MIYTSSAMMFSQGKISYTGSKKYYSWRGMCWKNNLII